MQHRFLICAVAAILAIAPAIADTTATSTTNVNPTNSLAVNPVTNQSATTSNVAQQINSQNLGANAYGGGITCQSPQIALGGYGARQTSGVGLSSSNTGVSIEYLAPVGSDANKSCAALAHEVLKARQLDNSFTMIQKCADFARSGVVLDPGVYPELSHACSGIHLAVAAPVAAPPSATGSVGTAGSVAMATSHVMHLSDFSPSHNSELRRIAMHRMERLAMLESRAPSLTSSHQRRVVAARINHEDSHLRAVIAEYDLENAFLRRLIKDKAWRAHDSLHDRILSYNERTDTSGH